MPIEHGRADWLTRRAAEHETLVTRAQTMLETDPRVVAAWLIGSRGRGQADAWSDVDLVVVARDNSLAALKAERRQFAAQLGTPLLIQDLPRNAPPGGAYLLVLYPGETGPLHLDVYWRLATEAPLPRDTDASEGPAAPEAPDARLARDILFFWAMAPIAAKYFGRARPDQARALVQMMAQALERVQRACRATMPGLGDQSPFESSEPAPDDLEGLYRLAEVMAPLTARLTPLETVAGMIVPEAPRQVLTFLDRVCWLVKQVDQAR